MDLLTFAYLLVSIAGLYLFIGLAFCIVLLVKGLSTVDPGAQNTGLGFKLLIIPGIIAFWPFLWNNWKKRQP